MLGMNESPDAAAEAADIEQNKVMGILAYIGILFLVPLLAAPTSRFAKYHANQGLVLFLFDLAVGVIFVIPVLGWIIGTVGFIARLVFMIMGIINAAGGKMVPLPLIGQFKILS